MNASRLWAASVSGFRRNLVPGLVLQAVAVGLLLLYYCVPAAQSGFERVGTWKDSGGYLFSAASTAVFGGLIPFVVMLGMGRIAGPVLPQAVFYLAFWFWKGAETDFLYRVQGWVFGESAAFGVVLPKVLADQFLYTPFWSMPVATLCFMWKDGGFSWAGLRRQLDRSFLTFRVPSLLLACWFVWIPAVTVVYCLPSALQMPMCSVILCFWSLVMALVTRGETEQPAPMPALQEA